MNDQQSCTLQNFDFALLDQLRTEADLHNIDMGRVKIVPLSDGKYSVSFDQPLCDISRFAPGMPNQLNARSAQQAEGLALLYARKIQVAERVTVRTGTVGWDSMQLNRMPLSPDELARHRRRLEELALQKRIAAELVQAVETAKQKADQAAAADLAARYPGSVTTPRKAKPQSEPVPTLPNVPTKRTHGSASK